MLIETIAKEKLVSYRVSFTDLRTGVTAVTPYKVSLFPSEVQGREQSQSTENIIIRYIKEA